MNDQLSMELDYPAVSAFSYITITLTILHTSSHRTTTRSPISSFNPSLSYRLEETNFYTLGFGWSFSRVESYIKTQSI
jgi:hypothetical protein